MGRGQGGLAFSTSGFGPGSRTFERAINDATGVRAENLSQADRDLIQIYVGGIDIPGEVKYGKITAEQLNRGLRDAEWLKSQSAQFQKHVKQYERDLNAVLDKVANYEGTVYRVVNDIPRPRVRSTGEVLLDTGLRNQGPITRGMNVGDVVTQKGFTSTARARNAHTFGYRYPSMGQTRLKIESRTGKAIERTSSRGSEWEVLFKSGTKFKVTGKKFNRRTRTWDITMREL